MSVIKKGHFSGGRALTPKTGNAYDSLEEILNDVADDLAGTKPAAVASTNAAVTAVADSAVTEVANAAVADDCIALANDLKAKYNAAVALINDLKEKYNAAVTLINELKTRVNAAGSGYTLKTTKES